MVNTSNFPPAAFSMAQRTPSALPPVSINNAAGGRRPYPNHQNAAGGHSSRIVPVQYNQGGDSVHVQGNNRFGEGNAGDGGGSFGVMPSSTQRNSVNVLLNQRWSVFLLLLLAIYVLASLLSGVLLLSVVESIESATVFGRFASIDSNSTIMPDSSTMDATIAPWTKAFVLGSGNLLAAGGLGDFVNLKISGYAISWIQQLIGIVMQAFLCAFILLKLVTPQTSLVFSKQGLVSVRNGRSVLVFRIGENNNAKLLNSVQITVTATIPSRSAEGEDILVQSVIPIVRTGIAWDALTVSHTIDSASPLSGISTESLAKGGEFERINISIDIRHRNSLFAHTKTKCYSGSDLTCGRLAFSKMLPSLDSASGINRSEFDATYQLQ